jgi:glycosyltransferase involved in cell wall biosynthesis
MLPAVTRDDIVYFSSVQPAQFMAAARWYLSVPEENRFVVAIEFGTDAGVDSKLVPEGNRFEIALRDFWVDQRPLFYRYAGRQLAPDPRFILSTFDPASSSIYGQLTGHAVWTLPVPRFADIAPVSRGRRPITVSFLGHQRWDKGYHLVPAIARMLLADCPDIKLLIHNGAPGEMPEVQDAVRQLSGDPRVSVCEGIAGPGQWESLLMQSDLIVSPYEPSRFSASYSAVTCEALAHGIPMVVPANTSLSRLLDDFGNPGVTFDRHDPSVITLAVKRALARFDILSGLAMSSAARWRETMGADKTVDMLLKIAAGELAA